VGRSVRGQNLRETLLETPRGGPLRRTLTEKTKHYTRKSATEKRFVVACSIFVTSCGFYLHAPGSQVSVIGGYNRWMARGWESKAVEAQQTEAAERNKPAKARLTPEERDRLRKIENLHLSLENVKQQLERTRQARHRAVLERAMAELEERIQQLGSLR
jgi:hypothetical protein